jgi:hypothetical protein
LGSRSRRREHVHPVLPSLIDAQKGVSRDLAADLPLALRGGSGWLL